MQTWNRLKLEIHGETPKRKGCKSFAQSRVILGLMEKEGRRRGKLSKQLPPGRWGALGLKEGLPWDQHKHTDALEGSSAAGLLSIIFPKRRFKWPVLTATTQPDPGADTEEGGMEGQNKLSWGLSEFDLGQA